MGSRVVEASGSRPSVTIRQSTLAPLLSGSSEFVRLTRGLNLSFHPRPVDDPLMFNRHRLRISLRVLMLLILLLGIWLGWRVNKARAQREAVVAVRKFGGWVHFDYEFKNGPVSVPRGHAIWKPSWGTLSPGKSPSAPVWLRRMLGDEYFQEIAHVSLFVDIVKGQAHAEPYNIGTADDVLDKSPARKESGRSRSAGNKPRTGEWRTSIA
jgi:hypothetical protein